MKLKKITYWVCTLALCFIFLYSAQMYFFNTATMQGYFENLTYPSYIVIPLAVLKVLGVGMVLWRKSKWLTEWAYAGFFFDLVLATAAHYNADHGIFGISFYGLLLLFPSYFLGKYIRD
ncbi:MAG: DoxX family protein [Winogradskyella arenosi]